MPPDEDTASRQTLAAGDGMAMMADYRSPIPRLLTTTAVKKCSILELLYMPSKTGGCSPFTMLRPLQQKIAVSNSTGEQRRPLQKVCYVGTL